MTKPSSQRDLRASDCVSPSYANAVHRSIPSGRFQAGTAGPLVGQAREKLVGQAWEKLVGQASVPVDGGKHKTPIEHTPEICKNQIRC